MERALSLSAGVEGWLTARQARRLYGAAQRVAPGGRVVEIGSFRGRSTIVLASAAPGNAEVIAIDPHGGGDRGPQEITPDARRGEEDYAAFGANLAAAGVSERVRHVRAFSQQALEAVSGGLDMLYIDGAHRYAPALSDMRTWGDRVVPGGTMLIHDAFNAVGVTLAQLRALAISGQWRYLGRTGSLAEYRREPLGAKERAANAVRHVAALPYFMRNALIKLLLLGGATPLTRLLGHSGEGWPY